MREMKDSGIEWIGTIPSKWNCTRLGGIYCTRNEKVSDEDYDPLSVTMQGILPQLETAAKTNDHNNRKLVKKGDFVINSRSDRRGACGISDYEGSVSLINTVLRPLMNLNTEYYNFLFHTIQFADEFYKWGHGIVNDLWTTGWQDMKKITVPIPPAEDQEKISKFLSFQCSQINELLREIQKEISVLEQYKLTIITKAVTHGLNNNPYLIDSGTPWIGDINKDYSQARLGIFCFVTKLAGFEYTDTMARAISSDEEVPIVRAQNVRMFHDNFIGINEFIPKEISMQLDRCALNKKSLLITFIGAGIGDICIFNEQRRFHLAPNVAKIEILERYKDVLNEEYLMYYLGSYAGKGEIFQITKASAQPSLSMETIRKIKIVLPPINQQKEIVYFLDKECDLIDGLIQQKKDQTVVIDALKKSLIYEYVTGKKEVPA